MPAVIEAELRAEAIKVIDDVFKQLVYCVRVVGDDELAAKAAFGAERGAVQHELHLSAQTMTTSASASKSPFRCDRLSAVVARAEALELPKRRLHRGSASVRPAASRASVWRTPHPGRPRGARCDSPTCQDFNVWRPDSVDELAERNHQPCQVNPPSPIRNEGCNSARGRWP